MQILNFPSLGQGSYRVQATGREGNGIARQWRALFHARTQLIDAIIDRTQKGLFRPLLALLNHSAQQRKITAYAPVRVIRREAPHEIGINLFHQVETHQVQ